MRLTKIDSPGSTRQRSLARALSTAFEATSSSRPRSTVAAVVQTTPNAGCGMLPQPGPAHARIGGGARSFRFVEAPHLDFRGKIAGIVPGHDPELERTVRVVHLGVGHKHIRGDCGIEHVPIGVDEHAIVKILSGDPRHGRVFVLATMYGAGGRCAVCDELANG